MKKVSKWPARALNLLVVLAMVISLSAILVAPPIAAAQEQTPTCNPTPVYQGCHLEVAVNTYLKDDNSDFQPQSTFNEGQCFYVNAVVVNNGNGTALAPITATIILPSGVSLASTESYSKTWANGNLTNASPEGLLADFWWHVCCSAANGPNEITVNVTSAVGSAPACRAEGSTMVYQQVPPTNKCLNIEIVEAPGMPNKVGKLGSYTMTMPGTVNPCQNFGIKAEITNNCDTTLTNVLVNIAKSGPADGPVGGDPATWAIGDLAPGQTKLVAWTLHCTGPGDVSIFVTSPGHEGITNYIDDPWSVHQKTPGGLEVVITHPTQTTDCADVLQPIKQPTGECGSQNFTVNATIYNRGDSQVNLIYAIVSANPTPNWVQLPTPAIAGPFNLVAGGSHDVSFAMVCKGTGVGNITITASGTDSGTGFPVSGDDLVTIDQKKAIARASTATDAQAYLLPSEVNKCQAFWVSFQYFNYSSTAWNDPAGPGNITACIHWTGDTDGYATGPLGNATLIDSVYYRRIVSGVAQAWQLLTASPTVTGNATAGYTSCVHIPVICSCCGAEVRWQFQCTDVGEVQFYSTLLVQQPGYTGTDTSETVCVDQVYKAHLIGDGFFFIQDDYGKMLYQEAVVPGTYFHVVIPVMNTGDAAAENVQVYFTLSDAPEAPCTKSFEVISYSGDATSIVPQGGGAYIANFDVIPGHSAVKAIVLVHCLCEGHVTVWVPDAVVAWGGLKGIRGDDANTGLDIPQANIVAPPCPRILEQVPFTVVIENPYTCQTFSKGTTFAVKAKITNGSTEDLVDVNATIDFSTSYATLVQSQGSQTATKFVGNITAGSNTEITWLLQCTAAGEVWIGVSAAATTPLLTAYSDNWPYTVDVHQTQPPGACLRVTILSPGPSTWIATGQQFSVSAKVENLGPDTATNVTADINPIGCSSLHYVTLVDELSEMQTVVNEQTGATGTLGNGQWGVVHWTLWGGSEHDYSMQNCQPVNDTICVAAYTATQPAACTDPAVDSVGVNVYPAAFLVTSIEDVTPDSISLGGLFTVDYRITNYGVASATSVMPTLSVSPAGAAVIAQTPDPTESMPRTIPGWSWGSPYNYIEGSFTLRAMQATPFTVTVTPSGDDECGWQPKDPPLGFVWASLPLAPIQSRFLGPASVTLEPGVSGGAGCPDLTSVNIALNSGWNLISLPLIPTNGNVATLFSGLPVDAIWSYSGGAWSSPTTMADGQGYWVHMTGAATLHVNGKVNPLPPVTPPTYAVAAGWNLTGFKSTCARTASAYLGGVSWVRIWGYANGAWVPVQSGDMLQPGLGYWIAATGAGTIFP